jgi:HSP20 family protein
MRRRKPSFFERLTGSVTLDEEKTAEEPEETEEQPESEEGEDWIEEENEEGQLTVDVHQNSEEIVIKAMVAGVHPSALDISITREMVTIKGHREEEKGVVDKDYFFRELYWGSFSRTILLPEEVDPDESTAEEKNGLLIIRLPKIDKGRSNKIKVKSG